ncbi:hypothetical protein B1992_08585 [Pseudoxanthomonas broegbernensis]|uniref:DUF423 domain-containing protein n=1 Tax=Pseudoxanthomonas broegbernensis TaxID=83619 RepID=A0A7V8GM43_9GAMM|nr:DUF423 domain-containing protein [Pseudoxanthomonas broegbernensis]KAF1686273.1 hypothetical protein B1992_08585 [Pseudoxanthomonas broegbernensis]MBB6063953.1 uncharacterized membrane protein YgdD (TMEM256/DUF423 family) [Pseudoxanthomonas broegbernensis]
MDVNAGGTGQGWAGAAGGVLAALAIGLSAYAAHGIDDAHARAGVQTASLYAFGHGVALAALARAAVRRLGAAALAVLLLGTVLFCGSVAGGALLGWPTRLAPVGGSLMMLGWLLWAADAVRR